MLCYIYEIFAIFSLMLFLEKLFSPCLRLVDDWMDLKFLKERSDIIFNGYLRNNQIRNSTFKSKVIK